MKIIYILISLLFSTSVLAFNYNAYKTISLDDLIVKSKDMVTRAGHKDGFDIILPPNAYRTTGTLTKMPYKCNTKLLFIALKSLKYTPRNTNEAPAINTCIEISSLFGVKIKSFIQDNVASYIPKELSIGDNIELYSIWVYTGSKDKLPRLLTNEFKKKWYLTITSTWQKGRTA